MDFSFATPEQLIEDARQGRMFVLVDDENRENEGDIIVAAELVTPEHIAFMAKKGSGLICMPMANEIADRLELELIGRRNNKLSTAFTVSIEARTGISTGISAQDRALTVRTAALPTSSASDIATPGHIFPLRAVDGGVLARDGHTEATIDIMRLAGLQPAGVICEIMKDDGTMARLSDLIEFCSEHGLNLGTIADLIEFIQENQSQAQNMRA